MKCEAVVVAAGSGRRFGTDVPKQFQPLAGEAVVLRSCRSMARHPDVDGVVLVLAPDVLSDQPEWMSFLPDEVRTSAGGETRTESVRRGTAQVAPDTDLVLVHDAVRPLVSRETVDRVRRAAEEGPAIPVVPVADTVKRIDDAGRIVETVERGHLRLAQTPQGFPADVLREVLERAGREEVEATDEAGLCERFGVSVRVVRGDRYNLKITRPGDLRLAELILESQARVSKGRG